MSNKKIDINNMATTRKDFDFAIALIVATENTIHRDTLVRFMIEFFEGTGGGFVRENYIHELNKQLSAKYGFNAPSYTPNQ